MKTDVLDKAEIVTWPENETQKVLKAALARLENGERWCKGDLSTDGGISACARGAINVALHGKHGFPLGWRSHSAFLFLEKAAAGLRPDLVPATLGDDISVVLNNSAKDFSEVRALFERAVELAADHV